MLESSLEFWLEQLMVSSPWELTALVLALGYLVLAAHQRQWCWAAAAVSCTIYAVLFWQGRLYMESLLQTIYIALAGYGWWQWQRQQSAAKESPDGAKYPLRWHLIQWVWLVPLAALIAYLLSVYTDADAAWLDTYTTVFSLLATWLVTKKAYETWWYWLVIDSVYVYLYASKGFVATALLFVVYLILVVYAMWRWRHDTQLKSVGEIG
ncbi:nicotinamide mononucleotide transporter [Idiomarina abyssalis]|jgi:nicotinamide mononucleotide transporter|uniref:Nicotinamide riboside transporter PnuC n=1 Tax=Idiomarina abyssalis TaxID=86102 RepID=A0A8I1G5N1_9GAMM|nr:nicotinamide riboside transporter PnuC [Idiomarina abyssalis]MBJ7265954.1 nicotinamide mononucleotide transporter [Idiomarina abyssalis]MBJ7273518.1 nicotinamide mononucleotide transporter [Idiomarina abyssalis]MBJ7314496.1 nicotinamide mononucleotide transporter [Idiomarina abyssalis]